MGKQGRRKRRHKRQNNAESNDSTTQQTSTSTLIKRIRHADPATRHAALAATSVTLLDPELLQKSNRSINPNLLLAVRERVMDDDLECAQAAAGCLANYVSFGDVTQKNNSLTSGWTIVLLGRLGQCHEALVSASSSSSTNCRRRRCQWWALTVQCLHATCALVERNPQALELLTRQPKHVFSTLLGLVQLGRNELDTRLLKVAAKKKESDEKEEKEEVEWVQDVTVYSARTLHSALDDNVELLEPWLVSSGNQSIATDGINLLQSSCTHASLPAAARLHCAGTLVCMRQLVLGSTISWAADLLQNCVLETVIPVLTQHLEYQVDTASSLLQKVSETRNALEQELEDSKLEKEVIQTVQDRKEPARMIARRQKKLKEEQKQDAKQKSAMMEQGMIKDNGDNEKMDDDNNDKKDETDVMKDDCKKKKETEHSNCRLDMEQARQAWRSALLPLQLALEISANLTSISAEEGGHGKNVVVMEEEEENMMDWGPDQETELMESAQQTQEEALVHSPEDAALVEALVQKGLPDRLVVLLKNVCTPLVLSNNSDIPQDVAEELADLQSKCGGCIGNCLGNLASWRASDPIGIWKELVQALQQLLMSGSSSDGMVGICSAMVVALKSRQLLSCQMQQADLDLFLKLLQEDRHNPTLQRDAACMLGILCSTQPHSKEVNSKVCSTLMAASTQSSAMVQSEVLNALMDIYGDDDNVHADVFESLHVLGYFQRSVPVLKKLIHAQRNQHEEEEVEQWKETALNASRFVQYKKGQL